jgi:cell division protein FtsN
MFHAPSFSIGLLLGAAVVLVTGYLPELLAPPVETPPRAAGGAADGAQLASQAVEFEFDTILRSGTPGVAIAGAEPQQQAPIGLPEGAAATPPDAAAGTAAATPSPGSTAEAVPPVATTGIATIAPPQPVAVVESAPIAAESVETAHEAEADRPPITEPEPAAEPAETRDYMLQAASFRTRSDADRLRAELLLLDLPATTGEVAVGNSVWYRVTVGPFPDQAASDFARERLRERNLTAIPFRR